MYAFVVYLFLRDGKYKNFCAKKRAQRNAPKTAKKMNMCKNLLHTLKNPQRLRRPQRRRTANGSPADRNWTLTCWQRQQCDGWRKRSTPSTTHLQVATTAHRTHKTTKTCAHHRWLGHKKATKKKRQQKQEKENSSANRIHENGRRCKKYSYEQLGNSKRGKSGKREGSKKPASNKKTTQSMMTTATATTTTETTATANDGAGAGVDDDHNDDSGTAATPTNRRRAKATKPTRPRAKIHERNNNNKHL